MSIVDTFLAAATSQLGVPYSYGDESPSDGFDCSGLVLWSASQAGVRGVPRTARAQQAAATPVTTPRPGDLVFYGAPAHHVGIYIGGGKIIHAPHTGDVVRIASVDGPGAHTYGRLPGMGVASSAAAGAASRVQSAASAVGVSLGLGDAGDTVISWATKALIVTLGLSLVGVGAWRAVGAGKDS